MKNPLTILSIPLLFSPVTHADVVASSDSHFVLRHEAESDLSPDALWRVPIHPATWWHPDHTYSGKSENLSLELRPGGVWSEEWLDNFVVHGTVIYADPGRMLRLEAPFGSLQALAAYTIWTISITANEDGSRVVFDEVSFGPPSANMPSLAKDVDYVKSEAIRRLAKPPHLQ